LRKEGLGSCRRLTGAGTDVDRSFVREFFSDGISGLVVDIRPVFLCQRNVARIREKTGRVYKS